MKDKIIKVLKKFETKYDVEVILAVESGSRGWGYASEDSDYDVRFVYRQKNPIDYMNINNHRGESHNWTDGILDFEGFDIYKFYDLLLKSNMNIIDWVFQDHIYIDKMKNKEELKRTILDYFDRDTYISHNYGLANKNYKKYFSINYTETEPTAKRYIYVLRSLFSAEYCAKYRTIAPINFNNLIKAMLDEIDLKEVKEMLEIKKKRERVRYTSKKWLDYIKSKLAAGRPRMEKSGSFGRYYANMNLMLLKELGVD